MLMMLVSICAYLHLANNNHGLYLGAPICSWQEVSLRVSYVGVYC